MLRYILVFAFALTTIASLTEAQNSQRNRVPWIQQGLYVNGALGTNVFCGDIESSGRFKYGVDLAVHKEINKIVFARIDIDGGQIGGSADWGGEFNTTYFTFTGGVDFMFLNAILGFYNARLVDPYISAGAGALMFIPNNTSDYGLGGSGSGGDMSYLDLSKYDLNAFTTTPMVYGVAGARMNINRHWGATFEIKGILPLGPNSDKLDGHDSGNSSDGINMGENPYDAMYTVMIGASYKFADAYYRSSSKYNRRTYMNNRKTYRRNAQRQRRR